MGVAMAYKVSLFLFLIPAAFALEPRGCNVCYREEMKVVQRNYSLRENHEVVVRDTKPCSAVRDKKHNWCKDFHLIEEERKMVKYCCEGYALDDADLRCKPVCKEGCYNGNCVDPDTCHCHNGWRGTSCNSSCPLDKWGPGCENECYCENGALCNPVNGFCDCSKGWRGANCSIPCSDGYHGMQCTEVCKCKNNALCNHITGGCNCTAGYHGPLCEEKCPNGTHGQECLDECKCQNGAVCHHEDGSCECKAGWTGLLCADICQEGHYGINCSNLCQCYNGGACDVFTGKCKCPAGFQGGSCEVVCPTGNWGLNCSEKCSCVNGDCRATDGKCICFAGFAGNNCQDRACPSRRWGTNCSNECRCKQEVECHPVTGDCWCSSDKKDEDCSIPNQEYFERLVKEEENREGFNVWKIVSVTCISLLMLQLIVAIILYSRKRLRPFSKKLDATLLPSYSDLANDEQH